MMGYRNLSLVIFTLSLVGCGVQGIDSDVVSGPKSELSRRFLETVVLGSEYGSSGRVRRFAKSPRISMIQGDNSHKAIVTNVAQQLNKALAGSAVNVLLASDQDRSAEILVYFAPLRNFSQIARDNGFEYIPGNTGFFWSFWNARQEISKSIVMIASDYFSEAQLKSVALEEITQAMGPMNDQSDFEQSIFFETTYNPGFFNGLSQKDQRLISFLYTKLQPGDDSYRLNYAFNRYWVE